MSLSSGKSLSFFPTIICVAILAIGTVEKKPAVIETPTGDVIGIRHKMFLSLTYDHRIIDGAYGGAFLRKLADYLENFDGNKVI